jgi:polyphosphate kinase
MTIDSTLNAWQPLSGPQAPPESPPVPAGSDTDRRLFNRYLSWLRFNDRVLSEAADKSVPPMERLRFATIVSSNLDEFFMVRVAEISRRSPSEPFPDGLTPTELLTQIREHVLRQKSRQAEVLKDILAALAQKKVKVFTEFEGEDRSIDREMRERMPAAQFILRRSSEPMPPLLSERIHVFVRFPGEYAIISIEDRESRLVELRPAEESLRYALFERWLAARAQTFFPERQVIEAFPFKIIRDADLRYHPDDEESLEEQIVEAVEKRLKAKVIRLEVDAHTYPDGALPLDLRTLAKIYPTEELSHLRYQKIEPQTPRRWLQSGEIFNIISRHDILLHHPYDSFDVVVNFLEEAARDPAVTRIYHTMYRTSQVSPIMEALKEASRRGKKVAAYVEIKARFDELNNVRWATELRKFGVKVVQPLGGFKVHCKLTQVFRQENGEEISYLHLGTGNYHPGTARQYTDLGLLTNDPLLGADIATYFALLTRRERATGLKEILIAPDNLQARFKKLIQAETESHREGKKGHIIAKMNSLEDPDIIEALYEASNAGVKVELIVRGICCLRPGVKGMSENIRVVSVVDRFLEHSRIYYFRAAGEKKIYLSSADWMPRNFYARHEIAFPIKDPVLKKYLREVVLANSFADNVKAWTLKPDGSYVRPPAPAEGKAVRSQMIFEALAKKRYKDTVLAERD